MQVNILQGGVTLNPNSPLLVNQGPTPELFFLRTTRHKLNGTVINNTVDKHMNRRMFIFSDLIFFSLS